MLGDLLELGLEKLLELVKQGDILARDEEVIDINNDSTL